MQTVALPPLGQRTPTVSTTHSSFVAPPRLPPSCAGLSAAMLTTSAYRVCAVEADLMPFEPADASSALKRVELVGHPLESFPKKHPAVGKHRGNVEKRPSVAVGAVVERALAIIEHR